MVTELDLKPARPEIGSWIERESHAWSTSREHQPQRSLDCAAMARMPLPSLLYYVLVGDGRTVEVFASGVTYTNV